MHPRRKEKLKESAFQLIYISPKDKEFSQAIQHTKHILEKRARFITYLWLKMIGKF